MKSADTPLNFKNKKYVPNDSQDFPVVIIGGGLAGSAAGAMLARAGWLITIFERETLPRNKLCGEFLSGESRRLLARIGCLDNLLRYNPPEITRVRFVSVSGNELVVPLPEPALGISRQLLDKTLFDHACACGADGFTGCEVRSLNPSDTSLYRLLVKHQGDGGPATTNEVHPHLIIGAYGRRGNIDHELHRTFLKRVRPATGFKMHHHLAAGAVGQKALHELSGVTEIYGLDGGYCGVNLVENNTVNVCMLLQPRALKRISSVQWKDISAFLSRENGALGQRLVGLVQMEDRPLSVSGMPFSSKDSGTGNWLFVGDAAGMIAPLCGDGQAMALESGIRVANLLTKKYHSAEDISEIDLRNGSLAKEWSQAWRKQFGVRMRVGNTLQSALLRPAVANTAIAVLRQAPRIATYLAGATRGHSSNHIESVVNE